MSFYQQLKERLNAVHHWPSLYHFKFIVPIERKDELLSLLPLGQREEKLSRTSRYCSVSLSTKVQDADAVLAIYQKVSGIEGILSL